MSALLEVRDGGYTLPRGREILQGVHLSVQPGDILCILGPNGVGKTTLVHCMTGLKPWTSGGTWLHRRPLAEHPPKEVWQRLGYVPQARANAFAYSVLDMVLLGFSARIGEFGQPTAAQRQRAMAVLERLEIGHLARRSCHEISGGELQLVFIARALVGRPEVLILDEPESHLDFKKQLIILDLIQRLAGEDGIACIMNTHFPNNALRIASHILLLGHDREYRIGHGEAVLSTEHVARFFEVEAQLLPVRTERGAWTSLYPVSVIAQEEIRSGTNS